MTATAVPTKQTPWWLILLGGIVSIILGILLLTVPVKTVVSLVFVLGFYWILSGIFTLVGMFVDHTAWGWKLFTGLLSIIAGIVVLRYPLISAATIPLLIILFLGIQGLIVGVVMLVMAFTGGGWGSGILGVLSIIFGLVLIANWSSLASIVALVTVTAIFLLVGGIAQIFQSFRQRTA